jgi:hypothetical protein
MPRKLSQIVEWFLSGDGLRECQRAYEEITIENGSIAIARFLDKVLEEV